MPLKRKTLAAKRRPIPSQIMQIRKLREKLNLRLEQIKNNLNAANEYGEGTLSAHFHKNALGLKKDVKRIKSQIEAIRQNPKK